jgi:ABC-type Fe3+/spermidine/putrescine transport system ATPase subunit
VAVIEVRNLVKQFGAFRAVEDISLEVEAGQILVIVGGSGSGKTTTLRCVAGLERPTSGTISIDGEVVSSDTLFVPPERRDIGMVFQSYALWPHMTIFDNIAYGLKLKRVPQAQIRQRIEAIMELVGLAGLGGRYPATLSGGQQQRVALARSAVVEPKVLLLDEPLSNLDAKLREQMRTDLRRLVKTLNATAIHITHDQNEAMAMADRVVYMRQGRIEQAGTPRELYRTPASLRVAEFVGTATFVDGTVVEVAPGGLVVVRTGDGSVLHARPASPLVAGAAVRLAIRPENVVLNSAPFSGPNALPGTIVEQTYLGDHTESLVETLGTQLRVWHLADIDIGAKVYWAAEPQTIICFPAPVAK